MNFRNGMPAVRRLVPALLCILGLTRCLTLGTIVVTAPDEPCERGSLVPRAGACLLDVAAGAQLGGVAGFFYAWFAVSFAGAESLSGMGPEPGAFSIGVYSDDLRELEAVTRVHRAVQVVVVGKSEEQHALAARFRDVLWNVGRRGYYLVLDYRYQAEAADEQRTLDEIYNEALHTSRVGGGNLILLIDLREGGRVACDAGATKTGRLEQTVHVALRNTRNTREFVLKQRAYSVSLAAGEDGCDAEWRARAGEVLVARILEALHPELIQVRGFRPIWRDEELKKRDPRAGELLETYLKAGYERLYCSTRSEHPWEDYFFMLSEAAQKGEHMGVLQGLGVYHLRAGNFKAATDYLERARIRALKQEDRARIQGLLELARRLTAQPGLNSGPVDPGTGLKPENSTDPKSDAGQSAR